MGRILDAFDAEQAELVAARAGQWDDTKEMAARDALAVSAVYEVRAERDTAMDALREHDVTLDELRAVAFMNADADGVVVLCADGSVHRVPLERLAALKAMADAALKGGG